MKGEAASGKSTSTSERLLTPRDLADAIGASESSVRRWVDAGRVRLSRTSGGHRRIPLAEAVRFIRETRATVVRPDLLGLDELGLLPRSSDREGVDEARLFRALESGDRELARGVVLSWYLAGRPLPGLFDGPLRAAMHRLGELWRHGEEGILVEHRASEIVVESLTHLRALIPAAGAGAAVALGGSPSNEFYAIPSTCAALTLADAGFRDVNYGPNTPPRLLAAAAEQQGARLVWVSISTATHDRALERDLRALAARLEARGATLVVGGRHAAAYVPRGAGNVREMASMGELSAFAGGVAAGDARTKKPVRGGE